MHYLFASQSLGDHDRLFGEIAHAVGGDAQVQIYRSVDEFSARLRRHNGPGIMKKQIPGDKSINHIHFVDNLAYLSCGFGIVVLDIKRYEIQDTYYLGDGGEALKVNQISSDETYIYAATASGIRKALLANPFLIDFNSPILTLSKF